MAKKPPAELTAWTVYRLAKKPVRLGQVEAGTEEQALERAFAELNIREEDRFKISVRRN